MFIAFQENVSVAVATDHQPVRSLFEVNKTMNQPIVWPPSGVMDVDMYVHHNVGKTLRASVENTTNEEDQYPDAVWP